MDDPIISKDTICVRARAAFARGAGRDDHKMNPHAAAVEDWQAEWDACRMEQLQAQRRATSGQLAEVTAP